MFTSPAEIAFSVGNIDIRWYGIVMSVSIIFGISVISSVAKKFFKDITFENICDISFVLIICGIIGARLYYVLLDYRFFLKYPYEIFAIQHGGLSVQGAILGGIIAGLFYAGKHKINFLRYADLFSFGLTAGQITGRWGNFFNSEAFGLPTNLPWKLYIPYANRPFEYVNFDYFHPTFLYESILNIFILGILYFLLKKVSNRKDGFIFFSYLILYSAVRIIVETVRIDSVLNIGIFHVAHLMSALFIIVAVAFMFALKLFPSKD